MIAHAWLDWLAVIGYLSFTLLIIWRIYARNISARYLARRR